VIITDAFPASTVHPPQGAELAIEGKKLLESVCLRGCAGQTPRSAKKKKLATEIDAYAF
jgi:hypothetical protein